MTTRQGPEVTATVPELLIEIMHGERSYQEIAGMAARTHAELEARKDAGRPEKLEVRPIWGLQVPSLYAVELRSVEGAAFPETGRRKEITRDKPLIAMQIGSTVSESGGVFGIEFVEFENHPLSDMKRSVEWPSIWQVTVDSQNVAGVEVRQLGSDGRVVDIWRGDSARVVLPEEQRAAS